MNRLKELREARGMTMKEVAQRLGMPYTTYVNYEKGLREPNSETLIVLADFFETSIDYLIGKDVSRAGLRPMPELVKVPRIGRIACGTPIAAEENIEDYDDVPSYIKCDFTLVCRGDSMINARIFDGDIVCIKMQPVVSSGDIAAVMVGEDEATLKRVKIFEDHVVLEPENPMYKPLTFWGEDMNRLHISGKATHFISTVR